MEIDFIPVYWKEAYGTGIGGYEDYEKMFENRIIPCIGAYTDRFFVQRGRGASGPSYQTGKEYSCNSLHNQQESGFGNDE